jgi:hypothetical protein
MEDEVDLAHDDGDEVLAPLPDRQKHLGKEVDSVWLYNKLVSDKKASGAAPYWRDLTPVPPLG